MSSKIWSPPPGYNLSESWIFLPSHFNRDRAKIRDTVKTIVKPRFESIGQSWKELSCKVRVGVPMTAAIIFAASTYYFFIPGILLGGMVLAICVIGKTSADEIRKNDLKSLCFDCENFLGQFEESCRALLNKIKGESSASDAIENFNKPDRIDFKDLRNHLESLENEFDKQFLQVYKTKVSQFHLCFLDLQSTTGYFAARIDGILKGSSINLEDQDGSLDDSPSTTETIEKLEKTSLIDNLEGKGVSLGLIVKIQRLKDNIQALRCSL